MFLQDLRHVARRFRRRPMFVAVAAITIGVGIGAAGAVLAAFHAVLLRPLPYGEPDRLVVVNDDRRARSVRDYPFSIPNFVDLQNGARDRFEEFAAVQTVKGILPGADGRSEPVNIAMATPNVFRVLAAPMLVGRDLMPGDTVAADGATPAAGAAQTSVLSYQYWQRRYGGSTAVIGQPLYPTGPLITGVLAPQFELLLPASFNVERRPDLWLSNQLRPDPATRDFLRLRVIGRLKPGAARADAQAEVDRVAADLRRNFPTLEASGFQIRLEPMHDYLVARSRPAITAMAAAALFFLLVAGTNVANLLLVHASSRDRELAVRSAIGATSRHLVGHVVVEAMVLTAIGTVLGVGLAWAAIRVAPAAAPAGWPRVDSIRLDWSLVIALALAGVTMAAILAGALAWWGSRRDFVDRLRMAGQTSTGVRGARLRNTLVVVQVALSLVLVIATALVAGNFIAAQRADAGYNVHGLLTGLVTAPPAPTPEARQAFTRSIRDRLASLPGVTAATAANPLPLADQPLTTRWGTEQALADPAAFRAVDAQTVLPGYFETMGARIVEGRTFADADNAPDRQVVIVDQRLAAKAFPSQSPIGKRLAVAMRSPTPELVEVIGVVAHQRAGAASDEGREQIFFTDGYRGHGRVNRWVVRTSGDPASLAQAMRSELTALSKQIVVSEVTPMEAVRDRVEAPARFTAELLGAFAVVAWLLAAVGLNGVLWVAVQERTSELGVRMAMGASPSGVFRLVVGRGLWLGICGIGIGLAALAALTPLARGIVAGLSWTIGTAAVTGGVAAFVAVIVIACWFPARRASHVDPVIALRNT